MRNIVRAATLLALSAWAVLGCGGQDATGPTPDGPQTYATADTPDQLVANFTRAFDEMNLEEYARALDPTFEFTFLPDAGVTTAATQGRDEELTAATRLFGGQSGRADDGSPLAAVSAIHLTLQPIEPWQDLGSDRHQRTYQASMLVSHADGSTRQVQGMQQLVVAHDGEEYRLASWRDLGEG